MSDIVFDSELYYNRRSENALCRDFPADAAIIDALYRWQMQIWNFENAQIPVLRVMNCAHRVAAHMLSGLFPYDDRNGYDYRIFRDMDNNRFLMSIVIVVLVAMLRCIDDSERARTCVNIISDDRPEDFYERLSLFNEYVDKSCKVRCRAKDLLQDATELVERIAQLEAQQQQDKTTISTLQNTINTMQDETKHIGYNVENMTINMSGGTLVQHADLVQAGGEVRVEQAEQTVDRKRPAVLCPYLLQEKICEMGIATPEQIEAEMREESKKDAKHFAAYLRKKEKAGILHFHGDTKKQILATLQAHFPNMKCYSYNNFIAYF